MSDDLVESAKRNSAKLKRLADERQCVSEQAFAELKSLDPALAILAEYVFPSQARAAAGRSAGSSAVVRERRCVHLKLKVANCSVQSCTDIFSRI